MNSKHFAIVIHSNNNLEIASTSLTELFDKFKNSKPEPETQSEPIKSTDKYNYGNTFIDYKFIMHKTINNNGRVIEWYEYNGSNKNPNKWNEIKYLTIYPNKKNTSNKLNANMNEPPMNVPKTRFSNARSTSRRNPRSTSRHNAPNTAHSKSRTAHNSRQPLPQVEIFIDGKWDRATYGQKKAYMKFLDLKEDAGTWPIISHNTKYYFRYSRNGFHEIQIKNDWCRIGIKQIVH